MRRAALALLAPAAILGAQALPGALTAQLKATPLLHAEFTQTRTLAALSRPLKSSGSLVVSRDKGVIWRLAKPMPLTLVVTPRGLVEVDRDGKKKTQASKDAPMVAQMAGIMKSLLEGQWSALEGLFKVTSETGPGGKWTITLSPRPSTRAFLEGVRIRGGAFIDDIQVKEASGDTTELAFVNQRVDVPLSLAETQLFAAE